MDLNNKWINQFIQQIDNPNIMIPETGQNRSADGIGQQQVDNDIFKKETSSINIIHIGKYNLQNKQSEGKVILWKQKETSGYQDSINKKRGRKQYRKQIQKQCKWIEKQYKHIQKQCQWMEKQSRSAKKTRKQDTGLMRKQIIPKYSKYQESIKSKTQKRGKFVQKQQHKYYKEKIDYIQSERQQRPKSSHQQHVEDNLDKNILISSKEKQSILKLSDPNTEDDNLETKLNSVNMKQEQKCLKIYQKVVPLEVYTEALTNQSEQMEIEEMQIDFVPRRACKTSNKGKNKREEIILNRLAFDYSQHCQEQSLLLEQQYQEHTQYQPQQILSEILQKNQSPMKSLEIEFCCGNNIVEVKISNVELTALKLSVCLLQKDHQIQTKSCISEDILSKYVQFQQIYHILPHVYRSAPLYRCYTLCRIIIEQEYLEDIKCQSLLQVQALILKCFCGAKNFCLMNAYECFPLSCHKCSTPLQICIAKLEIVKF